jgi:hypothetical protein
MRECVIPVVDGNGILGFLIVYGPGPDAGIVEAVDLVGEMVGAYTSKASAAAAIIQQTGGWCREAQ